MTTDSPAEPPIAESNELFGAPSTRPADRTTVENPKTSISSLPDFSHISNDLVWADVSPEETGIAGPDHYGNAGQSWDALDVTLSNGLFKPVSAHFLFPRSAKPFNVKVFNSEGTIVREFQVSFPSAGPSFIRWNGKDGGGRMVPPGIYFVKVLAYHFEQAIRIKIEK